MHGAKSFLSAFLTTWVAEYLCLVKNFFKAASVLRLNSLATWLKISASTHFSLLASFLCFRNILFAKGLLAPLTSGLRTMTSKSPSASSRWIRLPKSSEKQKPRASVLPSALYAEIESVIRATACYTRHQNWKFHAG